MSRLCVACRQPLVEAKSEVDKHWMLTCDNDDCSWYGKFARAVDFTRAKLLESEALEIQKKNNKKKKNNNKKKLFK